MAENVAEISATSTSLENSDNDDSATVSEGGGEVTALHDLVAGGVAGSASVVVGHPFDTIKVRLQTSASSPKTNASNANAAASNSNSSPYSFRSLFKGMAAPLSTAAVVNAIIFASYGTFTRLWEKMLEEDARHDELHGTVSGEGGVFIDHVGGAEHGLHDQIKDWEKKNGSNKNGHAAIANDAVGDSSFQTELSPAPPRRQQQQREDAEYGQEQTTSVTQSDENLPPISSLAAESAVTNDDGPGESNPNKLKIFMCGAAAGTVQAFVICPMEHIKCRLQVQQSFSAVNSAATATTMPATRQPLYKGPIDACLSITKKHGLFSGLYRGMGVTLWRESPAFGMYFATYDTVKSRVAAALDEKDAKHPIPSHAHAWAASALAGGISGAFTWAIIYPFDVIKTRVQTGPLEGPGARRGMWTVARDIVEEHGWRRMFRGLGVTLARAFPVNAIIFPVYEFVLVQLGDGE